MSDVRLRLLQDRLRNGELSRRGFVRQATALGVSAAAVGSVARNALAQGATPAASPGASPMASPVTGGTPAAGASLFNSDELRMVMTFNVAHASDLEAWEERKEVMLALLQQSLPLLIGTQEALSVQLGYFEQNLENYAHIGVSRQGNDEDEYNAILYDTTRVTVEESDTFWLSETPSEAGSMMPGEGHPRIATWGRFSIEGYPNSVYMFNTHLSFEEDVVEKQVAVLLDQLESIVEPGVEVIMTGDFNRPRTTHLWQMFQEAGFRDAWQLAEYSAGPPSTFHGWEGIDAQGGFEQGVVADEADYQIDWILYRAGQETNVTEPLLVQVLPYHEEDIYPSDHFPVVLTSLGNPEFEADALRVSQTELNAHDPLSASASITNSGEAGVSEVILYLDRLPVDSRWVALEAGESREVTFETRLYDPGEHTLSIQLLPPEVVTVVGVAATLSYVDLSAEPYVLPNDVIPITATIENHGSFEGSLVANLFVDDTLIESNQVRVPGGGSGEVGFVHSFEEPGAYSVGIGSQVMDVNVMVELPADWMFERGDDPTWSDPDFDDSAWETAELPASWEEHADYTEDFVYGWYRQTVTVPQEWEGRPLRIILGQIDDADKSFFNGELIGETGRFPDDEGGFDSQWNEIREYTVPPELVNFGSENTVAIRIYDDLGGGGLHGGPVGMLPLDIEEEEES